MHGLDAVKENVKGLAEEGKGAAKKLPAFILTAVVLWLLVGSPFFALGLWLGKGSLVMAFGMAAQLGGPVAVVLALAFLRSSKGGVTGEPTRGVPTNNETRKGI